MDTIIHVWQWNNSNFQGIPYKDELPLVTAAGYQAILSSCWYLNFIDYGRDWPEYYACEPYDFEGSFPFRPFKGFPYLYLYWRNTPALQARGDGWLYYTKSLYHNIREHIRPRTGRYISGGSGNVLPFTALTFKVDTHP